MRNNFGLGFVFEAIDRFTGPANRIAGAHDRLGKSAKQAGAGVQGLGQNLRRLRDSSGRFLPTGATSLPGARGAGSGPGPKRDSQGRFLPAGVTGDLPNVERGLASVEKKAGLARLAIVALGTAIGNVASAGILRGFQALTGSITGSATSAIEFESAMADVNKVLPEGTELAPIEAGAKQLAKDIGILPTQVAALTASLAQSGIAGDELVKTSEDASKLAVAFSLSGEEAGQAIAKLRTGLGLSRGEVNLLTGSINELSNKLAATAPQIIDATQRVGSVAKAANISAQSTAALATAMIASGATSEVAGTGVKNFIRALASGDAATKRQRLAFKALGLDAVDVAKALTQGGVAAEATVRDVVMRIGQLEQHKRLPNLIRLFGSESIGAIGPLATNIHLLTQAFDIAGNKVAAAGSVQKEYETRSKTTAAAIDRLKANFAVLRIELGNRLLPIVRAGIERLNDLIEWARGAGGRLLTFGRRVSAYAVNLLAPVRLLYKGLVQVFSQGGFSGAVRAELNRAHNAGIKRFVINVYALFHRLRVFLDGVSDAFAAGWKRVGPIVESIWNSLRSVGLAFIHAIWGASEDTTNTTMSSWREWGTTVGETLIAVLEHVASTIDWWAKFIENNEWLVKTALWGYAAFKIFAAGIWLATNAGRVGAAVAVIHARALMVLRWASISAAFGMKVLHGALTLVSRGLKVLRVAVLANPVLAIVAGLAMGALLVYQYWDPISEFFGGLWESVTNLSKAALDWIVGKIEWVGDKLRQFKDIVTFQDTYDSGAANEQRNKLMGLSTEQLTSLASSGGPVADQARDALKLRQQGAAALGQGARTFDALSTARSRAEAAQTSVVAAKESQKEARYAAQGDQMSAQFRGLMERMEMANANDLSGGQNISLNIDGEKLQEILVKKGKASSARGFRSVDPLDDDE